MSTNTKTIMTFRLVVILSIQKQIITVSFSLYACDDRTTQPASCNNASHNNFCFLFKKSLGNKGFTNYRNTFFNISMKTT